MQNFDYEALPVETREFVKGKELSIKARTSQTIWENGRDLLEVKERLEHGQFMNWCEVNFPWSHSTVNNMINVAVKFPTVGNLDISAKTLYLLAQNSTPESARTEAIEKAESGEVITHKQAKDLIEAHKAVEEKNRHIEMLENTVKSLQGMLPTEDILQKIASMEQQLAQAKNQKPQTIEVPPPGYDQLKEDLKQAQERARSLDEALLAEKNKPAQLVEKIVKIKDEDAIKKIERQKNTYQEKANAMTHALADYERRIKELEGQLEVDNPTNIDIATAKALKSKLRYFDWDIKSEVENALKIGGDLRETQAVLEAMIGSLTKILEKIMGQVVIDI